MSNSDYNKIVSAINNVSHDYTYSPDPNNLICIDSSNNRIGINTLEPVCSLHISGGTIIVNNIYAEFINAGILTTRLGGSISVTNVSASTINSAIVNVSNTLDISNGRIKANYIDISSILDISRGNILVNKISTNTIDISSTLDISRGNIISRHINSTTIDISSTLNISRGHIISNKISTFNIDISGTLDISQGHINAQTIDVSSISVSSLLDISRGHIKAQTIDISSIAVSALLDISHGHIEAKIIDASAINVSSLFDISRGRINTQTIDASAINVTSLLDISQGRIKANTIDASAIVITSLLDISQSHIEAKTIDASAINVTSLFDISQGHIEAKTIDVSAITVSSLLDISRGTILANTINGSAITVNANAASGVNIISVVDINMGYNFSGITISITNVNGNAITINNSRVATTQHIKNAIPAGTIIAYNSTTPPNGWVLCDGSNGSPDLRGRFILGATTSSTNAPQLSSSLSSRTINISGGLENVYLGLQNIPDHTHSGLISHTNSSAAAVDGNDGGAAGTQSDVADWSTSTHASETNDTGNNLAHENMPPYYVLIYIMKTDVYDFCYNVVSSLPSAPNFTAVQSDLSSVIVNWSVPSNIGDSAINSYSILMNDINQANRSASTFTYTKTGLTSGQIYVFKVTATNNQGTSLSISSISITMVTAPTAPTVSRGTTQGIGLLALDTGLYESYNVTINWTTPTNNGGSPITRYTMYLTISSDSKQNSETLVFSDQSNNFVQNFRPNSTVNITMTAQNNAIVSISSNILTFTVP